MSHKERDQELLDALGLTVEELLLFDIKKLNKIIKERSISDADKNMIKDTRKRLKNR